MCYTTYKVVEQTFVIKANIRDQNENESAAIFRNLTIQLLIFMSIGIITC